MKKRAVKTALFCRRPRIYREDEKLETHLKYTQHANPTWINVLTAKTKTNMPFLVLCLKIERPAQPPGNPPAKASPCKTTSGTRQPYPLDRILSTP